jgi:hypothetical protein
MHRFVITIEGQGWTELDEVELPRPPAVGDTIETKFGLCLVTEAELSPGADHGTIVCRLP